MPNSSSEQPFTLFTSLTAARDAPQGFPVSEFIRHLIVATGYEVCSLSYPRFTLSSYQFLTQARDIRDHINRLIHKVENNNDDEDPWALFDEYSDLIDPTEDVLFKFLLAVERESNVDSSSFTTMNEYRTWSDEWEQNRTIIDRALQDLHQLSPKSATQARIKSLKRQDDKTYTQLLVKRMDKALRELRQRHFTPEDAINKFAPEILQTWNDMDRVIWEKAEVEDINIIWNTKTIKLLIGAFETAARDKNSKVAQELRKPDIVKKLVDLGKNVKDLIEKKKTPDDVKKEYDGIVVVVTSDDHQPRKVNYNELVLLVHGIHRPFLGQAEILLKFFKLLVDRSVNPDNNSTNTEQADHLNDVMEALKNALLDGKQAVNTLATGISPERKKQVENRFLEAEKRLKDCFITLRLPQRELMSWEDKIKKARQTDAYHMKRLREMNTTKVAPAQDDPRQIVTINVLVRPAGWSPRSPKREFACTINARMRMTTFLWYISSSHLNDQEVMINPVFKSLKGQAIDMDQEVRNVEKDLILEVS